MCAIVDANVGASLLRAPDAARNALMHKWIRGGGRIAIGGKLRAELAQIGEVRRWLVTLSTAGRVVDVADDRVDAEEEALRPSCESDDSHVIALARVSGARVVFTDDAALRRDVKNARLLAKPRGKIYSDASHAHLLTRKTCAGC